MTKQMKYKRIGLAGILTISLAGLPQFAGAADRFDRRTHYNSDGNYSDYVGEDRGRGYDNARGSHREYRNQDYRNGVDWNSSYYDSGYLDNRLRDNRYGEDYGYYRGGRSAGQSGAIIGGSAAAGAAVGAIAGGGKGAAIGAAIGGIGGLIFDRTTRNHDRDRY
jgi:hypothetical protein